MTIVHVITDLGRGGAEGVLFRLCVGLKDKGVKSKVISLRSIGPIGEELNKIGVPVLALGLPSFSAIRKVFSFFQWIREADVVDSWLHHSHVLTSFATLLIRRPLLWNVRGAMQDYANERGLTKFILFLCRLLSFQPRYIVYNSDRARINHEALGFAAKGKIIFNGFHIPELPTGARDRLFDRLPIPQDYKLILTVGRYHRHKDYGTFCAAVVRLLRSGRKIKAILVGRDIGWHRPIIENAVPEEFKEDFIFTGEQTKIGDFYSGCDIFALSSMTESFPNVLGEAMSYGAVCVSTEVGAVQELLDDSRFICPARNPEALATVMAKALDLSPEERNGVKFKNRARMEQHFTLPKMINSHFELYRELCPHLPHA